MAFFAPFTAGEGDLNVVGGPHQSHVTSKNVVKCTCRSSQAISAGANEPLL